MNGYKIQIVLAYSFPSVLQIYLINELWYEQNTFPVDEPIPTHAGETGFQTDKKYKNLNYIRVPSTPLPRAQQT